MGRSMSGTRNHRTSTAEFLPLFDAVMAHYGITGQDRMFCLAAARNDWGNAVDCYRAIAASLEPPVVRSRYGKGAIK